MALRFNRHVSDITRQIAAIAAWLIATYLAAAYVMLLIEQDADGALITTYGKSLWYALVTVSTVGYGDLYPVTPLGRILGGGIILMSVGFIGFVVSRLGELASERSRRKFLGMDDTTFTGHYIVIGWNDLSRIVIKEMISAGFDVGVLTGDEKEIAEMRSVFGTTKQFFVTYGLAQDDAAFQRLNIAEAAGAILLTGDDTETLITVLELKRLNPAMKITAHIKNSQLRKTVVNAGVSYVISPNEIVGRMIASAAFEPDVSVFLEDVLSTTTGEDDLDVQEYRLPPGHELVGASFKGATERLEERTGARLLSFSRCVEGSWTVCKNGEAMGPMQADDYLIVLANDPAGRRMSAYLGVQQGRKV